MPVFAPDEQRRLHQIASEMLHARHTPLLSTLTLAMHSGERTMRGGVSGSFPRERRRRHALVAEALYSA